MKLNKFSILCLSLLISSMSYAHTEMDAVHCDHVNGLQVLNDFTPDGKPYVSKTLTDLYTTKSDDGFMTHIAVSDSKFKEGNIEVSVEVLNSKNNVIKKYLLKTWGLDKTIPEKRINKTNILDLLTSKVTEPYDTYANLDKSKRARIDISKVPYDARVSVLVENKTPFCSFVFKYGSVSEY